MRIDDSADTGGRAAPAGERLPIAFFARSFVLRAAPEALVVPPECACCGGGAAVHVREGRRGGPGASPSGILVPYCAPCHRHASRATTRVLATSVSTVLLAATLLAGIPLLLQPSHVLGYAALVLSGSLLPMAASRVWAPRPDAGHTAAGRAAFFAPGGSLVCSSRSFADRLAISSSVSMVEGRPRLPPLLLPWALGSALGAALLCPLAFGFYFPETRIVNLTDETLVIWVDGSPRARVTATSAESPSAGVVVRIPAGDRELRAVSQSGRVVDVATVLVTASDAHLYAPGSAGTCFRVETTGYGRGRGALVPPEPLTGEPRFWALPEGVDVWFSPSPPPEGDDRSTGGQIRSLRQAPCAPGEG